MSPQGEAGGLTSPPCGEALLVLLAATPAAIPHGPTSCCRPCLGPRTLRPRPLFRSSRWVTATGRTPWVELRSINVDHPFLVGRRAHVPGGTGTQPRPAPAPGNVDGRVDAVDGHRAGDLLCHSGRGCRLVRLAKREGHRGRRDRLTAVVV